MPSAEQKLVAVVGGTGNLGSSVALSLLKNPSFRVRVLSRNPDASKAQILSKKGIEVVKANNWNQDELLKAFQDCWAVFINIDSDNPEYNWKTGTTPTEYDMGKIVVDTAISAGVRHLVHASLPHASRLTNNKVKLISFDDKARTSDYALEKAKTGKLNTATIVSAGWFLENAFDPKYVAAFGGFARVTDDEGFLTWKTPPMGNDPELVPWLAMADDYGDFVHGVLLDPVKWSGKWIHGVSESVSFSDMTAAYQKATGKKSRYVPLYTSLEAGDANKTKEVNGLFDLMHAINGDFFDGVPTDHETAKLLKKAACDATGRIGSEAEPMSVESFFYQHH